MEFLIVKSVFVFIVQSTLYKNTVSLSDLRLCDYDPIQEKAHSVLQLKTNVP